MRSVSLRLFPKTSPVLGKWSRGSFRKESRALARHAGSARQCASKAGGRRGRSRKGRQSVERGKRRRFGNYPIREGASIDAWEPEPAGWGAAVRGGDTPSPTPRDSGDAKGGYRAIRRLPCRGVDGGSFRGVWQERLVGVHMT